jgi:predicted RNA binding protein YcfA (HicA-like mRNA interferase family)
MGLIDSKRAQRLYDQVAGNRKNCAYEDLERLLEAVGFAKRSPRSGSSHVTFKRGTATLTVPRRKPLKEHYVGEALLLIDEGIP